MKTKEIKNRDEERDLRSRKKVFFLIGEDNPAKYQVIFCDYFD